MSGQEEQLPDVKTICGSVAAGPVTGLGNVASLRQRLTEELARVQEEGLPLAICYVDVDRFAQINDRYGFLEGDRLLAAVAEAVRPRGEAFWLGADKLVLLLPSQAEEQAVEVAQALTADAAALTEELQLATTISVGVAVFPAHAASARDLFSFADAALYWAKEKGGGQANVYQLDEWDKLVERLGEQGARMATHAREYESAMRSVYGIALPPTSEGGPPLRDFRVVVTRKEYKVTARSTHHAMEAVRSLIQLDGRSQVSHVGPDGEVVVDGDRPFTAQAEAWPEQEGAAARGAGA